MTAQRAALPDASQLARCFNERAWLNGQRYAERGAVQWTEVLPADPPLPGYVIQAEVVGQADEPYEQSISLSLTAGRGWMAVGRCSCPVGHQCKHVAAVLQDVLAEAWFDPGTQADELASEATPLAEPQPMPRALSAQPVLDRWLRQQESRRDADQRRAGTLHTSLYATAAAADHAFFVVAARVAASDGRGHWLTLQPGQARRLKGKGGALGKFSVGGSSAYGSAWSRHLQTGEAVYGLLSKWQSGQQRVSWQGLSAYGHPESAVCDELGAHTLEQAARSGALVLLTPERHLHRTVTWGEPLPLTWRWQALTTAGDTTWLLTPSLPDPQALLCLGEPPVYLDPDRGVCGRVLAPGLTVGEAREWMSLPPMDEAWMLRHAPRLRPLLPALPEPVRSQLGREVRDVLPVACVRVWPHPRPKEALLQLQLQFDYDGVRGAWAPGDLPQQQMQTAEGPVQLWRSLPHESAARLRLIQAGYVQAGPSVDHALDRWQADRLRPDGLSPHDRDTALLDSDFAEWREAGWRIELDAALQAAIDREGEVDLALQQWTGAKQDAPADQALGELRDRGWFGLSMGFVVGTERINLLPLLPQLVRQWAVWEMQAQARNQAWPTHAWLTDEAGRPLRLPTAPLKPWLAALYELVGERAGPMGEALRLDQFEALRLASGVEAEGGASVAAPLHCSDATSRSLQGLVQAIRTPDGVPEAPLPEGLQATLRPYQHHGYSWLQHLRQHQLGGVLADDMGLGKTLQTIAHLLAERQAGRLQQPALIVAPTSLVGNWRSELDRFAPTLRALVLQGQDRHLLHASLAQHDVVITTYPLLLRDDEVLTAQPWSVVVLDEAQAIKNARTRAATVVQGLQAGQRLCLTGTPMENHLGEVWSLFHFLMPGYLANEQRFKQVFRTPIEKHGDTERLQLLRKRLQPFMLRRTKAQVATELPPKVEAIEHITLAPDQANLYEMVRATTEAEVRHTLEAKGLARSHITVLDALLKLRQVCCDPKLLQIDAARKVQQSAKMDWLVDNLPALISEGRRVLVFSAFSSMLSLIEEALAAHTDLKWVKLTGQSKNREALITRFTSGEVPLFLISLKAGGVGLNLPQADTVIHVDPWWNPAAEDQATDRAHRIGQQSTVFVYKLVAQGTLEERIVAMQARKAALADGLHGDAGVAATRLTEDELGWLLQPIGAVASAPKGAAG
ncbi:MAG: hypothetical protein RI907_2173 [Pseudomonadota bacterium]